MPARAPAHARPLARTALAARAADSLHCPRPSPQRLEGDVAIFLDVCGRLLGNMRGVAL